MLKYKELGRKQFNSICGHFRDLHVEGLRKYTKRFSTRGTLADT